MILLSLALLAAPALAPEPQRYRARARHARIARVTRIPRPRPLLATCLTKNCRVDPNAKYRVADTDDSIDFKTRVVERGAFANCGVTGMPVCPSKGMPVLKSDGE